jgi:hypothetical protein
MHFDTHHDEKRETETITKLKQLKIIPLRQQSYLVSINEFDEHAIYFPPQKSIHFSKHLKLVLDDVPTLDEQLLDFIEDKYPQRVDSIKKLLRKLGENQEIFFPSFILFLMQVSAKYVKFKRYIVNIFYQSCPIQLVGHRNQNRY